MNQPTVRDRSTSPNISSRPCPSRSSSTAGPATAATPPAPVRHRQHQARQQHIVDAAMERRRHPRQQRFRHRSRQRQRQMTGRAADIARRIERAVKQRERRRAQHGAATTEAPPPRPACLRLRPSRCAQLRNEVPRSAATPASPARDRPPAPPPGPGAGSATTRHPPPDGGSSAADGRPIRPGVKPHRLQHPPGLRRKPRSAACDCAAQCSRQRSSSSARAVDPPQTVRAATAPGAATPERQSSLRARGRSRNAS